MSENSKSFGQALGSGFKRAGKMLGSLLGGGKPEPAEHVFIETLFLLFGHLARADGHVSQQEAELGEKLIDHLELNRHGRRLAVEQFERGKAGTFELQAQLRNFNSFHPPRTERSKQLLDVLIELARADGRLRPAERGLLEKIAESLGVTAPELRSRLDGSPLPGAAAPKPKSEPPKKTAPPPAASPAPTPSTGHGGLERAYALLGLLGSASDDEVRQAYRRLLSRLHPDKLVGQGLRGDALKGAQAKTVEVRAAYELICGARGMR